MPKMQSSNSNSELYADVRKFRAEICKWLGKEVLNISDTDFIEYSKGHATSQIDR